jgi:hypothetical protein
VVVEAQSLGLCISGQGGRVRCAMKGGECALWRVYIVSVLSCGMCASGALNSRLRSRCVRVFAWGREVTVASCG